MLNNSNNDNNPTNTVLNEILTRKQNLLQKFWIVFGFAFGLTIFFLITLVITRSSVVLTLAYICLFSTLAFFVLAMYYKIKIDKLKNEMYYNTTKTMDENGA